MTATTDRTLAELDADHESVLPETAGDLQSADGGAEATDEPDRLLIFLPPVGSLLPAGSVDDLDLMLLPIPQRIAEVARRRAAAEQYARQATDYIGRLLCHPAWGEATQQEIADRLSVLGYGVTADAIGKQQRAHRRRQAVGPPPTGDRPAVEEAPAEPTASHPDEDIDAALTDLWSDAT